MSDLVKSKRTRGSEPAEDLKTEEEQLPDVSATPNASSNITNTPKPTAANARITMADIKAMMAQTAHDITVDLNKKHQQEMSERQQEINDQNDAMKVLQAQFTELQRTTSSKELQTSPFETPRAARPQDLVYKQILTASKEKVKNIKFW